MSDSPTRMLSHHAPVPLASRTTLGGATVWLTGLPGSGKTTAALLARPQLAARGLLALLIDGDQLRGGLSRDLGFSGADRDESVRRAGEIALLGARQGAVSLVSLVSPRRAARDAVRARHEECGVAFLEVFVDVPVEICARRDPKDLYRRSREGLLVGLTGVDDPYEAPRRPELTLATHDLTLEATGSLLTAAVLDALEGR